jgi:hypothetical protein
MSPEEDPIREAHLAVDAVRALLLAPTSAALEGTVPHLERAAACVAAVQTAVRARPAQPQARAAMMGLRHALGRLSVLLENAGDFYGGWSQYLALAVGGYTRAGEPAAPRPRATLSLEG